MPIIRACHIGDLHFWGVTLNPRLLWGKRALGVANVICKRRRQFQVQHAPLLVERLRAVAPNWFLFSGDFSSTALPSEFRDARAAVASLRSGPGHFVAVPGNHDRYTPADRARRTFEAGMGLDNSSYPDFHNLGDGLWLASLDCTAINGMKSFGAVQPKDLVALRSWRLGDGARAKELWVLCHFPAEDPPLAMLPKRREELHGGEGLAELLESLELPVVYMHGHHHVRWLWRSERFPSILYLNGGAPFLRRKDTGIPDLGFHELTHTPEGTTIAMHLCDLATGRWTSRPIAPGLSLIT